MSALMNKFLKNTIFALLMIFSASSNAAPPLNPNLGFMMFYFAGDTALMGDNEFATFVNLTYPATTPLSTVLSNMPSNMPALMWSFATTGTISSPSGSCGTEKWANSFNAANVASANVTAFVAAQKYYGISAGGSGYIFKCNNGSLPNYSGMMTYLNRYNSAYMIDADFDIEGYVNNPGTVTATLCNSGCTGAGNVLTVTNTPTPAVALGTIITGTGVPANTWVTAFGTGSGGAGTYTVSTSTGNVSTAESMGQFVPNYTPQDISNLVQAMVYAQGNGYPNLQFSFNIGGYGGSNQSYGLNEYNQYVYTYAQQYGLKNYVLRIQTLAWSGTVDSTHCILNYAGSACEMGMSGVKAMINAHQFYGVPYSQLGDNPEIGAYPNDGLTIYDIPILARFALANNTPSIVPWQINKDRPCPSGSAYGDQCSNDPNTTNLGYTNALLNAMGYGTMPSANFVFSPYVDYSAVTPISNQFAVNLTGTPQTALSAMPTKMTTLTWGWGTGTCGSETWNGTSAATIASSNIANFIAAGKYFMVGLGGANGTFQCNSSTNLQTTIANYFSEGMIGLDFDLSNGGYTQTQINNLVQAVVAVQTPYPQLRYTFSIPSTGGTAANGLNTVGQYLMTAISTYGLTNYTINLQVLDTTNSSATCAQLSDLSGCEMGQTAVNAATNFNITYGVPYSQIELTSMIGQNDTAGDIFTLQDVCTTACFAAGNNLAGIHYRSFARDVDCSPATPVSATCNSYGIAGTLGFANLYITRLKY